jgi:hypothetical protein
MWNIDPIRDQAMHLATNRTMAGPMYDFVSGTLDGLNKFLLSERALLDSLETKYAGTDASRSRDWVAVRGMLAQRIEQLETGVAQIERMINAAHGTP